MNKREKEKTEEKILDTITEIAFSPREKTSDRLRALDLLTELLDRNESKEETMAKLDALLALLGG